MVFVKFIGHSTFELQLGGSSMLIDPFYAMESRGRKRLVPPSGTPDEFSSLDLIFITHEHDSHCEPSTVERIVEFTGATVVAPKPALARIGVSERNKVDVRTGDEFTVKDVGIEVVKAIHPQSAYPVGFVIKKGGVSVYHAGDTYEYLEMNRIKADFALLPAGGAYTMDPVGASKAVWNIRPKYVVPMHYNTYENICQDLTGWEKNVKAKVLALKPGQRINI